MSRLGKSPIEIPKGVEVSAQAGSGSVVVKGPKGTLSLQLPKGLTLEVKENEAILLRDEELLPTGNLHGLFRTLIRNQILGVTTGFEVRLSMVGVGYRAAVQGSRLEIQVGFSHPTAMEIPKSIRVAVDKGTMIVIQGSDKQEVGQFAASIRSLKPPEPYKGKGIRYENEYVRKKEGKAAKGKTA
ncbi:MAG: 50S ribosomal protein L6 [Verrucomicrobiota bacterium]|nr:50S ribosomal protein L6 [Verrucomicrobiota bacterium]